MNKIVFSVLPTPLFIAEPWIAPERLNKFHKTVNTPQRSLLQSERAVKALYVYARPSPLQPPCPKSRDVQNFSDGNVRENGKLSPYSFTFPRSAQHNSMENTFKVTRGFGQENS
jgi:hypothetical protein